MANQYNNKVALSDGTVLIDLTSDTVTASALRSGYSAHDRSGALINGSLHVVTYYTGSSDPAASLGENGDIYLKVVS